MPTMTPTSTTPTMPFSEELPSRRLRRADGQVDRPAQPDEEPRQQDGPQLVLADQFLRPKMAQ